MESGQFAEMSCRFLRARHDRQNQHMQNIDCVAKSRYWLPQRMSQEPTHKTSVATDTGEYYIAQRNRPSKSS